MKKITVLFLAVLLAACASAQPSITEMQNAAATSAWTAVFLTLDSQPTATPLPPTVTPTATYVYPTPSPTPTPPLIPIITPDAMQVQSWSEYQAELANALLPGSSYPGTTYGVLCEWDILGRSGREVYVWAMCSGPGSGSRKPAVIYLETDGSIQKVEAPMHGSGWTDTIQRLFPADVREKIDFYYYLSSQFSSGGRVEDMRLRLQYRRILPEEPPLNILSAVPFPDPTEPVTFVLPPNSSQVTRWEEYETAFGEKMLAPITPKREQMGEILCEWMFLGQTNQEEYVWVECMALSTENSQDLYWREGYSVVHLNIDGTIQSIESPGMDYINDFNRMFPEDVQRMSYGGELIDDCKRLDYHLRWRILHPEELPLIVLSSTPVP